MMESVPAHRLSLRPGIVSTISQRCIHGIDMTALDPLQEFFNELKLSATLARQPETFAQFHIGVESSSG